jgi:hypothetical protein
MSVARVFIGQARSEIHNSARYAIDKIDRDRVHLVTRNKDKL